MLFDTFTDETLTWWNNYFKLISEEQKKGTLYSTSDGVMLYPNIMLFTKCTGYYVVELIGAVEEFSLLTKKIHKEKSIYRYFSQLESECNAPILHFTGAFSCANNLCFSNNVDIEEVKKRFPQIELYKSRFQRMGEAGSLIGFHEDFISCCIENCILINRKEDVVRCKSILSAYVVKSSISNKELIELYRYQYEEEFVIKGVYTVDRRKGYRLILVGQLQSMYLFQKLKETTIGKFLDLHPDIIKSAFKTDSFLSAPTLNWIEHDGTCNDKTIIPDFMVKREDGFYNILDLKTALLNKSRITKADRSRRRFIDYVEEGVSQLANYKEYFSYVKNAEYAESKYGIKVSEPKLILIVGSWENVKPEEVTQACRKYRTEVEIIDYDTFCQMFLLADKEN